MTSHDISIRTEPFRRVAGIAHTGDYQNISRAFETLGATLSSRGSAHLMGDMVGVFYEDARNAAPENLRAHAGALVPDDFKISPPLEEVMLPAGQYAVLLFRGPYTGLQSAYDYFLGPWLATSSHEPQESPVFERYLNSPMTTRPEDLMTEICLPLKS